MIGVVSTFRRGGELSGSDYFAFQLLDLDDPTTSPSDYPSHFLLEMREGTPLSAQEEVVKMIEDVAVARDYKIEITTLEEDRAAAFKYNMIPLIAVGIVAALLLGMVGLSLTGVLWQHATQRIEEIGLRRALGGATRSIYAQFLGESLVVASVGVVAGTLFVIQFPLLDVIDFLSGKVYMYSLAISMLSMYTLVVVCSLYPGRLAASVPPAEALHYE